MVDKENNKDRLEELENINYLIYIMHDKYYTDYELQDELPNVICALSRAAYCAVEDIGIIVMEGMYEISKL